MKASFLTPTHQGALHPGDGLYRCLRHEWCATHAIRRVGNHRSCSADLPPYDWLPGWGGLGGWMTHGQATIGADAAILEDVPGRGSRYGRKGWRIPMRSCSRAGDDDSNTPHLPQWQARCRTGPSIRSSMVDKARNGRPVGECRRRDSPAPSSERSFPMPEDRLPAARSRHENRHFDPQTRSQDLRFRAFRPEAHQPRDP